MAIINCRLFRLIFDQLITHDLVFRTAGGRIAATARGGTIGFTFGFHGRFFFNRGFLFAVIGNIKAGSFKDNRDRGKNPFGFALANWTGRHGAFTERSAHFEFVGAFTTFIIINRHN
jgi:hypothetical protein